MRRERRREGDTRTQQVLARRKSVGFNRNSDPIHLDMKTKKWTWITGAPFHPEPPHERED